MVDVEINADHARLDRNQTEPNDWSDVMATETKTAEFERRASEHVRSAEEAEDAALKALHFEIAARDHELVALENKISLKEVYASHQSCRQDDGIS